MRVLVAKLYQIDVSGKTFFKKKESYFLQDREKSQMVPQLYSPQVSHPPTGMIVLETNPTSLIDKTPHPRINFSDRIVTTFL